MFRPILLAGSAAILLTTLTLPTVRAQGDSQRLDTVIVTASRVNSEDLSEMPNATLKVRADFVLFELSYVNGTIDLSDRRKEMERMYNNVLKQLKKHSGLELLAGDIEEYAPIETAIFDDIYYSSSQRGVFYLVVKAKVGPDEDHTQIRKRVEAFIEGSGEVGRSQAVLDDEQYLGVDSLKKYRPALIKAIWDDIYAVSNPIGDTELDIQGLEARTQYLPVGALELELFIPYSISYSTKVAR